MSNTPIGIPLPTNEPTLRYAPGSTERRHLKQELERQVAQPLEIPLFIDGKTVHTGATVEVRAPHDHRQVLAVCHQAGQREIEAMIAAAKAATEPWARMPWSARAAIFLKAADLLSGPRRWLLNAATMLGQSKTAHQADIDSACEMADFLRFNVYFWDQIFAQQPPHVRVGNAWNRLEYRPLEGFVFAVTPFNFTAIGGNLPTAPAMAGNTVIWKPATTALLSNYLLLQVLREAGLPEGVINFLPGRGSKIGDQVLNHPDLAGLHFTGSTSTFNSMWKLVGSNLSESRYRNYPRLVGETGGKDFVFACPDADLEGLAINLVRGAFEYQGQKCSAASRAYVPRSLWPQLKDRLVAILSEVRVGDVRDFRNFMGAVIDKASFENIRSYIRLSDAGKDVKLISGGICDSTNGWMIEPTLIETSDPSHRLMTEEIFGPVLTIYPYPDRQLEEMLDLVDSTSPYALTGAVFSQDRALIEKISWRLRYAAGNLYINDKPTGAIVGQQPFGGARASGTNDKAGSHLNLLRWVSPRTIKETMTFPHAIGYPSMEEA